MKSTLSYVLDKKLVQWPTVKDLVKADLHSVEFSDWRGNLLYTCEDVALDLNRMLRLCQILSAWKILMTILPCLI